MTKSNAEFDSTEMLDRVEELVSLLVDDVLCEESFHELSTLLEQSMAARSHYVDAIQLHVDLREYYSRRGAPEREAAVLGLLGADVRCDLLSPSDSGIAGLDISGLETGS